MTNSELLRERINRSGLRLDFIREKLGISYPSLKKKIDGDVEFKASEIFTLCAVLGITNMAEQKSIFFARNVEENSTNSK